MTSATLAGVISSALAVISAIVVAFLSYRGNVRTARAAGRTAEKVAAQNAAIEQNKLELERRRLDDHALEQTRITYERLIADMRLELDRMHKTVDRMQAQNDRVADQLAKEQDVSNQLRNEVRAARDNVERLRGQMDHFKSLLEAAGVTPPPHPDLRLTRTRLHADPPRVRPASPSGDDG